MTDRMKVLLRRVVIAGLLVLAAGMAWYSATIKGDPDDVLQTDNAVERLIPERDTPSAIRQAEIGIDLTTGYDADLQINGVDIPQDEERNNAPENQVFFAPGEGKSIEALAPGDVEVTAIIWRPIDGETRERGSRTVSWTFRVA